jgi:hypothetical protein
MRIAAFVISLLLLGGAVDATRGWLIALVVLTALAALRPRLFPPVLRPALDLRLAALVLAALLLAGAVDPTRDWLIGLSIATGMAAFMPRALALDDEGWIGSFIGPFGYNRRAHGRAERRWDRWERRWERRARRLADWEEDWP